MAIDQNLILKNLFLELISNQNRKIFLMARKIVPQITEDDLYQPQDYVELDQNPSFRHEEGILEGLYTAYHAFLREQSFFVSK